MTSRSERSSTITPSKRTGPKNYRFEADVFPAVLAVAELLHAGDRGRFAEDALVEALYDVGVLKVAQAPLMPRVEQLKTSNDVAKAVADVESLITAMAGRMASQRRAPFLLRNATFNHAVRALFAFPAQTKFTWPAAPRRREVDKDDQLHVKITLHPRLDMAVEQWMSELAEESARAGRAFALQRAVRMKLTNLGVNHVDYFKNPKLQFRQPHFTRLLHSEATFETRAMEERFLAVIQALEIISLAAPNVVVPASFKSSAERLAQVAEAAAREE
jgi:hypothetical protein